MFQQAQLSFWEIDVSQLPARRLGAIGEEVAFNLFQRAGYLVSWANQRAAQRGDLRVLDASTGEFWRVEVKAARRGVEGHWQFSLRRRIGDRICTDVAHADYVLLLAFPIIGNPVPFLIPVGAISTQKQITLSQEPDKYAGKWAVYRQKGSLKIPENLREEIQ